MKNNLVRKVTKKEVNGKSVTYVNYYLIFENGKSVSIMPRYLPTENIKDADKKQRIISSNRANAQRLDDLADTIKYGE